MFVPVLDTVLWTPPLLVVTRSRYQNAKGR